MDYRHSSVWPVQVSGPSSTEQRAAAVVGRHLPVTADAGGVWRAPTPEEVDGHMQQWADAGWELVSANASHDRFGLNQLLPVYTFFWRQPSP